MKKIIKRFKKILKNEDGSTGTMIIIGISFILIYNVVVFLPAFLKQQDVNNLAKELVKEIEYEGKIDSETYSKAEETISKMNLGNNEINYKFTGEIRSNGKIQHREHFKVEVKGVHEVTIANFFSESIKVPFPLKKSLYGKSEVYYKPSDM